MVLHKNEPKECSEEEVENGEFLSRPPPACSFRTHSGFDENQSMDVIGNVGHPQEQVLLFFFFFFLEISSIIKIRKDSLNSEVAVNPSCVL